MPAGIHAVEGGQSITFRIELHPRIEQLFNQQIWIPRKRLSSRPRWPSPDGPIAPCTKEDTALRRRLRKPLRHLMPTYRDQYTPIDTKAARFRQACNRCSQRSMGPHDNGCQVPGSYNMTGLFCTQCMTVVITRSELERHVARCYGGQVSDELLVQSAFFNEDPIRLRKCTVKSCAWQSHIYGCWCTHTILHRFAVLHYGVPQRPHYINMGTWYDWGYRERNRTMSPPLEIFRMLGCLHQYVRESDEHYVWQMGMSYFFPRGFPREHRCDKITIVNFDEVLPFLKHFTFRQIQDRTLRDLQFEVERLERERRRLDDIAQRETATQASELARDIGAETIDEATHEIVAETRHELMEERAAEQAATAVCNEVHSAVALQWTQRLCDCERSNPEARGAGRLLRRRC